MSKYRESRNKYRIAEYSDGYWVEKDIGDYINYTRGSWYKLVEPVFVSEWIKVHKAKTIKQAEKEIKRLKLLDGPLIIGEY